MKTKKILILNFCESISVVLYWYKQADDKMLLFLYVFRHTVDRYHLLAAIMISKITKTTKQMREPKSILVLLESCSYLLAYTKSLLPF